ncbi:hypothetical protein COCHEDRAFT_1160313 [Bipolaris maydis C5]|uniref:Peptidase A1 domain-containing protein n=1 Tax=Cochliobolus heterostrophus (strain C5 / ATCC 48332 / race O) TaxID=701091 RepID=M2TY03_COCH5|nr:hypothetical protein COCHEDRAFT_1160313 [Bipolaris maydis C5]KAJ6203785.1 aspartic peptidase domain-containing protein [Bipolaris maydis]KAJ6267454.1 aspartic peptidase domain-containing protein [Bipolaris maydis]KAJ6267595.1 aspartic peptidase domain-containing protein [Bipolaris maydis]
MTNKVQSFILRQTDESKGIYPFFKIQVGRDSFSLSNACIISHFRVISRITISSWLYSTTVPEASRGCRNVYDPGPDIITYLTTKGSSTTYGDGLKVTYQKAVLANIGLGEVSQNEQLVFMVSFVEGQKGIAESDLMEGILGLQPQYGSGLIREFLTFWAKLAPALPKPVFVVDLKFNGIGEYIFGTIPYKSKEVQFWEGLDKNRWRLPITKFAIGKQRSRQEASTADFCASLDTASTSLWLPSNIVQAYYSMVPGYIHQDGLYLIPQRQVLPDLYLYIGERHYEVKIPGAFFKPQGLIDDKYYPGRLEESSETHGALLGHPFFFAVNVILKGNDNLSVGLVKKDTEKLGEEYREANNKAETCRESSSCIQDGPFCSPQ